MYYSLSIRARTLFLHLPSPQEKTTGPSVDLPIRFPLVKVFRVIELEGQRSRCWLAIVAVARETPPRLYSITNGLTFHIIGFILILRSVLS